MPNRTSKSKPETKKHADTRASSPKRAKSAASAQPAPSAQSAISAKPAASAQPAPSAQPAISRTGPKKFDPVPLPEHGGHSHSYAAHLGGSMHEHTSPASTFRHVPLREPPQQMSRIGKQHR